jgi:hypothetical protein
VNSVVHTLTRAVNSWTSFHRFEIIFSCIELLVINEKLIENKVKNKIVSSYKLQGVQKLIENKVIVRNKTTENNQIQKKP